MTPPPLDSHVVLEQLLEQQDWMRRIARRLVGDAKADDLVQDAYVAMLERPPGLLESPRAWLTTVVRNLSRQERRAATRRADREADVARDAATATPADVTREMGVQREITGALLELEEPFRTALFLRFVRDLSFAEVARAEGVPLSTAHSRVTRGLELLRERLDAAYEGDRRAWVMALLPVATRNGLSPLVGGLAVTTTLKLSLAAATVAAGALLLFDTNDDAQRPPAIVRAETTSVAPDESGLTEPASAVEPRRAEITVPEPELAKEEQDATVAAAPRSVHGSVVTTDGAPLPGVTVGLTDDSDVATTGALGDFTLELPISEEEPDELDVVVRSNEWYTLVAGDPTARDVRVVAERRASLSGIVVSPDGLPVEGARVSFQTEQEVFRQLGIDREIWGVFTNHAPEVTTDVTGSFELPDRCSGAAVFLLAQYPGFETARRSLADGATTGIELVLGAMEGEHVAGIVVTPEGDPAPGARVSLENLIARADDQGRFRVDVRDPDAHTRLRAVQAGYLPAEVPFDRSLIGTPVVLELGGPPLSVAGRVVDEAGAPVPGAIVWAGDPSPLGYELHRQGDYGVILDLSIEEALRGGYGERGTTADRDGRFSLGGLVERDYGLRVLDPRTLRRSDAIEVTAGIEDVELVLVSDERVGAVSGRILDGTGAPLVGVTVVARRFTAETMYGLPPDSAQKATVVDTDAEGRFHFDDLAIDALALTLTDDRLKPYISYRVFEEDDPTDIEITVGRLCDLQVVLTSDPELADKVRVLDGDDEPLSLIQSFGAFLGTDIEAELTGGRTSLLRVDERGRTLVLLRDEEVVTSLPIELDFENALHVEL